MITFLKCKIVRARLCHLTAFKENDDGRIYKFADELLLQLSKFMFEACFFHFSTLV